jgi:hypothetical protein
MDRKPLMGRKPKVDGAPPTDVERTIAHFQARVERNKTRRFRDGDPPAALPMPVEPRPKGGGFSGGASVAMTFTTDELA